ncbi:MAG: RNA polymerase sigma factor [Acidobacteria bacterium]|nr:RNA polymerase sigma factor [Acidobacteriota bacterium]
MIRRKHCSPEHFDSFVAELVSSYETTNDAPLSIPERRPWTDEELSRIRRELRKLTALRVLNAPDAEDIVQDTLLTLIHSRPEKELEKGPLVWSIGILRNKIGNYYRKGRYRARCEEREAKLQQGLFQTVSTVSPEGELMRGELRNVIAAAVERLPHAQKKAIKMLIAGLKPGEIAAKMSPERYQTVINHLHRGRKKLAQELTRHGFGGMHEMKRSRGIKKQTQDESEETESSQAM